MVKNNEKLYQRIQTMNRCNCLKRCKDFFAVNVTDLFSISNIFNMTPPKKSQVELYLGYVVAKWASLAYPPPRKMSALAFSFFSGGNNF